MNNIVGLDSNTYVPQVRHSEKITEDNNIRILDTETPKSFIALAEQPDIVRSLLQGQSLMTNINTRPTLSAPSVEQRKVNGEHTNELVKLTASIKSGDISKLERAAALAASLFSTQNNSEPTGNSYNLNKSLQISASPSGHPVHSQRAIENGTDITSVDASKGNFINLLGKTDMIALFYTMQRALMNQEAIADKSAAKSSSQVVEAANRAGNRNIDAEKKRMTGAITSGSISIAGQGLSSARTMRALTNESKSINNNLSKALIIESKHARNQSSILSSADNMLHKGLSVNKNATALMESGNSMTTALSGEHRNLHNQVQLKTNHTRVGSEFGNTMTHSGQKMVDGAFGVSAAAESKEAEMARADQSVHNEIANTHQQTAKKAAESKAKLDQLFDNLQNANSSTISFLAERLR